MKILPSWQFPPTASWNNDLHPIFPATGKKYLVLHGDKFDGIIYFTPWLSKFGDEAYEWAMWLSGGVSHVRRWLRLPYWSLSAYLKFKVKKAVEFLARYEEIVVREAEKRGCQGVICGHVHTPADRMIGDIHYLNDGDWVESCSALVEHMDGRFEIIYWHRVTEAAAASPVTFDEAFHGAMQLA